MDKNEVIRIIQQEMQSGLFTARKLGDTPTDNLSLVPRKYVNMFGSVASRPNSSVATNGQRYFNTDTTTPMTYFNGSWYNGVGSIIAIN